MTPWLHQAAEDGNYIAESWTFGVGEAGRGESLRQMTLMNADLQLAKSSSSGLP